MDITGSCAAVFSISVIIFAASVVGWIIALVSRKKVDKTRKEHSVLTPLNIIFAGVLIASFAMSFPVYYYSRFGEDIWGFRFFKSLLISFVNALQIFFLNSDFAIVKEIISDDLGMHSAMATAYSTFFALLYIIAPFLTFGFLLSFFKYFFTKFRYSLSLPADVYYMSELNERSLALARDIIKNGGKGRKLIVFANVNEDLEKYEDLIGKAKKLGAVCLKNEIVDIGLKKYKIKKRKKKNYLTSKDLRTRKLIVKKKKFRVNKLDLNKRLTKFSLKSKRRGKKDLRKRKLYMIRKIPGYKLCRKNIERLRKEFKFKSNDGYAKGDLRMRKITERKRPRFKLCLKSVKRLRKNFRVKPKRKKINYHKRKIYLISDDEDKNLKQALEMIDDCRGVPEYDNYDTQFFVFANGRESEVLLDSVSHSNMKVRRVTEYWNTILRTLNKYKVFNGAETVCNLKDLEKKKIIDVLVVGVGRYGEELIKMLCWMGQIPNCEINIFAFDKYDVEDRLRYVAPELVKMNDVRIGGEPYYNIIFNAGNKAKRDAKIKEEKRKGIDVKSSEFCDEIENIAQERKITAAFVALGNDELNVEVAIKLRSIFGKANILCDSDIPPIYAMIINSIKSEIFNQYGEMTSAMNKKYDIEFIDSIAHNYNLEDIERESLEKNGLRCHLAWISADRAIRKRVERKKLVKQYEEYEYFRKSSIATSAHKELLETIKYDAYDENGQVSKTAKMIEHNRWSAYMRAEGFVYDEKLSEKKIKDDIARVHHLLKPYKDIGEAEAIKDAEVVAATLSDSKK